ncbi:MAG: hypothetical protein JNM76_06985 [Betaproteobacteria bacterium]|nr:hypothetical protein [Betaproteobacteria bacterium]
MKLAILLTLFGWLTVLSACTTTGPATIAAQCDVKPAVWRLLSAPPPEAATLHAYFERGHGTRLATVHWFESVRTPRELMACVPSFERAHDGRFTGCASIRMRFSAQVLSQGIDPARPILAEITGC